MARRYNQDCILANALDILGERWTMLILRELFLGPLRFGDLQANLPGMGANLLSKRLKDLEEAGIIKAVGGDGKGGYRLSEIGDELRPAIRQLIAWSIHYFKQRPEPSPARDCIYSNDLQPDSVALAIEIFADYCKEDLSYVAQLTIDDYPFTLYYMNQEMIVRRGADAPAAAKISTDVTTMMKAFRAELSLEEARARMQTSGDEKILAHIFSCIVHEVKDVESSALKVAQR